MEPIVTIVGQGFDLAHLILFFLALGGGVIAYMQLSGAKLKAERLTLDLERATDELNDVRLKLTVQQRVAEEAKLSLARAEARSAEDELRFKELAHSAVRTAQSDFMTQADQRFEKLVEPIQKTFGEFKARVDKIEETRTSDKSLLQEQIKGLSEGLKHSSAVTGKLVAALTSPKGSGNWGEESLRNVLDMAGMGDFVSYITQAHDETDRGRLRPDAIINMPGGRQLVVDAKASTQDYVAAFEAESDADREAHMLEHARKLRDHVRRLSTKEYWKEFEDRVDFVAMYIPGDQFFAGAMSVDRELFDFAAKNRVIIVTPATLIALAKAVAYGWRQEEASKNAMKAASLGRELYKALATMGEHITSVGKGLSGAMKGYNDMVGSLERNVLSKARQFEDLQISESGGKAIPDLENLETEPREIRKQGELGLETTNGSNKKLPAAE
jgi:DNA recombination protein RmuC